MKRTIITGPDWCAVTEDGILAEFIQEDPDSRCGVILTGKTDRLMPGMKCAFVDIGRKKSGFLPLEGESGSFAGQPVKSGETMILQVKKEETGGKGAYLTRDITLPGAMCILMPMNRYIGVSSRITDEEVRERLKKAGEDIAGGRFGIVMRNAAADADPEDIRREAEEKYTLWQQIREKAAKGGRPGTVLADSSPAAALKADYATEGYEEKAEEGGPGPEIRRQLKAAMERTVRLPGGGNIVTDRCEAMTVIDVSTASSAGRGSKERTVTETNLEACEAIARTVRLRNLGGIILIDFIDMESETDRSLVLNKLAECFRGDRVKTVIHGWTKLQLLEMTRKRTGRELTIMNN